MSVNNIKRAIKIASHLVPQDPIPSPQLLLLKKINTLLKHLVPKVICTGVESSLSGRARAAVRHLFQEGDTGNIF